MYISTDTSVSTGTIITILIIIIIIILIFASYTCMCCHHYNNWRAQPKNSKYICLTG